MTIQLTDEQATILRNISIPFDRMSEARRAMADSGLISPFNEVTEQGSQALAQYDAAQAVA